MKGKFYKIIVGVQIFFLVLFGIILYKERDSLQRFCRYPFPFVLCPICDYPCFFRPYQWKVALGVLLTGIVSGRAFCGIACPVGTIQDGIWNLKSKVASKLRLQDKTVDMVLRAGKYIILVMAIIFSGTRFALAYEIMPDWLMIPALRSMLAIGQIAGIDYINFWVIFLLFTFVIAIIVHRAWCKYLCPMGLLFGVFNKISYFKLRIPMNALTGIIDEKNSVELVGAKNSLVKKEKRKCYDCRKQYSKKKDISTFKCSDFMDVCTTGKPLSKLNEGYTSVECTRCLKCITTCSKNAIYFKNTKLL